MKKRFTEEQIIGFLREAEAGMQLSSKQEPISLKCGRSLNEPPNISISLPN